MDELRAELAALQAAHAAERRAAAEALAQLRSKCADLEGQLVQLVRPQAGRGQESRHPLPGAVTDNTGDFRMSRRWRSAAASPQEGAPASPVAPEPLALLDLPDPLLLKILAVHPEACFDCTEINRRLRRVSLEAAGGLAGEPWALLMAAERGHVAALRALLDGGADIEAELDNVKRRALHVAVISSRTAAVRLLLERGADVKAVDRRRCTALHWGARSGSVALVQLLLDAGSDANSADFHGRTALHWAASMARVALAQLLLNAGARIDAVDAAQQSALHWAAGAGHTGVVELLVSSGADVHLRDEFVRSALWAAAEDGHTAVVRVLLAAGADVHAADSWGRTPLAVAQAAGHAGAAQALVEAGATH